MKGEVRRNHTGEETPSTTAYYARKALRKVTTEVNHCNALRGVKRGFKLKRRLPSAKKDGDPPREDNSRGKKGPEKFLPVR